MFKILPAITLVTRRSLANWKLLASIVMGVLVAVMLVSSTPMFSNVLSDLGLRHALNQQPRELLDIHVYLPNNVSSSADYQETWSFIKQQTDSYLGKTVSNEERSLQTYTFEITQPQHLRDFSEMSPAGYFRANTNFYDHVHLVDGRYPAPVAALAQTEQIAPAPVAGGGKLSAPNYVIEAVIGSNVAKAYGISLGEEITLYSSYWGSGGAAQITVRVTGFVEPNDVNDEYWFQTQEMFTPSTGAVMLPILIPEETLWNAVSPVFPRSSLTYNWYYYVDITQITSLNARGVGDAVVMMENNIISNLPLAASFTTLNTVIKDYSQKQLFTQIPLFLLIFQIVGIILYYVATVANMVIEQEATEIALLRSRGGTTWQIFGILFMEGALISAVGGIAGPFLGALVFASLGKFGPFRQLSGGGLLEVRFSGMVFILAAVTAVFCLLAFMIPAIQAARRGIVQQRQQLARPPNAPFWQRYYLDIALLVVGAGLYYELRQRGTLAQQPMFGDLGLDPLLLITPLLFMIAVAIIFLRLFPLLVAAAEKIGKYVANPAVIISLRYMARNPVHYSRLILLLMLAASVGAFSASFLGTLDRSYIDRTRYVAGADARIQLQTASFEGKGTLYDRYGTITGVDAVSAAYRCTATVGTTFTQTDNTLFAVDPVSMADVAFFRNDFAPETLSSLMAVLAADAPVKEGLVLPADAETLGLWIRPAFPQTTKSVIWARIEDGKNQFYDFELGSPTSPDWQYLETSLIPKYRTGLLPAPVMLQCIWISSSTGKNGDWQGFNFDDLQVTTTGSPVATVVDNFDDVSTWTSQENDQSTQAHTGVSQSQGALNTDLEVRHGGAGSARYTWINRNRNISRGIFPNMDLRPLQAIVSRQFLQNTGIKAGQSQTVTVRMPGQYLTVEAAGVIDYFPTIDPAAQGFMLVNLDRLVEIRNRVLGSPAYTFPNEIWVSLTVDKDARAAALTTIQSPGYAQERVFNTDALLSAQKSDPLIAAGWGGILTLAFFSVALVSALGFIVYAYLSAKSRRLEFAVLRSLGFSLRQIIMLISFEQVFIILMGMGIGTYVGMKLSGVMMPFLQLTERGARVLPPFQFVMDWSTIITTYSILAVAFTITISLVVLFFSRVAVYRTLRMGDQ